MLSDHTLQGHGPALRVGQIVRGEDLGPGAAGHGVGPESEGGQTPEVVVGGAGRGGEHQQVDQAGGGRSGVELTLVLTLVTRLHTGDLEVVVRRARTVNH